MKETDQLDGGFRWWLAILALGMALALFACSQEGGKSGDLSKKAPPSLGAISSVDGSEDEKKDSKKPQTDSEKKPEQAPAASQPAQTAPKQ